MTEIAFFYLVWCAFITACLTRFLYWAMGEPGHGVVPGRIFSKVGLFIAKRYAAFEKKKGNAFRLNPWKIGVCVYCLNIWVSFAVFAVFVFWYLGFRPIEFFTDELYIMLVVNAALADFIMYYVKNRI